MFARMYLHLCSCRDVGMCNACVTSFFSPVSLFSSASVYLYREGLEGMTGSSKPPSVGRWHLSPLHLHLILQTPKGSRAAGNQCSPSTSPRRVGASHLVIHEVCVREVVIFTQP